MNIEPRPIEVEVETAIDTDAAVEAQKTGLTDIAPGTAAHFPTPKPRLSAGGQKTLKALRGQ